MRISCIIPSTCSDKVLPFLKICALSLKAASAEMVDLDMIIVSEVKSARKRIASLGHIHFLYAEENVGFAGMNNVAIDEALEKYSPDYVLLINDDARVKKNFFKILLKTTKNKNSDVIIPLVYKESGGIDSFGAEYFSSGFARNSVKINTPTTIAPANCVFYKVSLLKRMKKTFGFYFNPILKFYFEDVELSVRVSSLGANIIKVKNLIAYHFGSLTSIKKSYFRTFYSYRNVIWLIIIGWPLRVILKNIVKIGLVQGFAAIKGTWHFGPGLYLKVIWSTLINLDKLLSLRKVTLGGYANDFKFENLLSPYMYRTQKGIYV